MQKIQKIEMMDIVLKFTGVVQQSNLKEFEIQAIEYIDGINTDLNTDEDFMNAKDAIKSCKETETKIKSALDKSIMSMEEVAAVRLLAESIEEKIRKTRLMLEKKVKTESALRKEEITSAGIKEVSEFLSASEVAHAIIVDSVEIINATKNKRSIVKLKEAVSIVVDAKKKQIKDLETLYLSNFAVIHEQEKEYPGLFPDIKKMAISPIEVVEAQISSRVSEFKFKVQQKKIADDKAKAEKELAETLKVEAAKKAKAEEELAEKIKVEAGSDTPSADVSSEKDTQTSPTMTAPSFDSPSPAPPAFADVPDVVIVGEATVREATVIIKCVASMKQEVIEAIKAINGVTFVSEGS